MAPVVSPMIAHLARLIKDIYETRCEGVFLGGLVLPEEGRPSGMKRVQGAMLLSDV